MKRTLSDESGVTLIEVLTVTAIIGILAAAAITNYAVYKVNGYNATAAHDARAIMPAAEFSAAEGGLAEPIFLDGTGGPLSEALLPGASSSPGVVGTVTVGANTYTIDVEHQNGNLHYQADSTNGLTVSSG